ncbi:DUF1349 domain-containing protein [Anoxybacterium hadale]|uniref:DUF1349 domain-containing protein n=1 Tax=Anoxybacterium hadale TaxID=3408580 RepID=A0ACD1A6A8_9FIRM|nr:DUF1349 domain-containing protein [Clostridiales bacterium]
MHKKSKRILSLSLVLCMCMGLFTVMPVHAVEADAGVTQTPIYMDPSYSYAERAADLVGRMSGTQKGSQMYSQSAPAIVPANLGGGALNVPATTGINGYTWWQEALHGYSLGNCTNSNSYPQNTSVGNTWNPDLYYTEAGYIGDEIRERASKISSGENAGNAVNLTVYSPTVNLHRDPRWGRNEESYSEDPYLMSKMGAAFVQGIQGMDREGNAIKGIRKVNATVKHYVANNSERNRLDGGAETSLRALREYYTAPYRNIIQEADVSSVMQAYSTLNGDPSSWSSYLIETLLRQTYGFSGYMTGDCDSVSTIKRHNFTNPYTGKVLTTVEQLSQAMAHGMDLECSGGYNSGTGTYGSNMANMLAQSVTTDKGKFTENQVDVSLHRLMTARMQTGEWDSNNPYTKAAAERIASQTGSIGWQTPERLKMIDDMNAEAVVMLKNNAPAGSSEKILPLAVPASGEYKVVIVGAWQTNSYLGLYSAGQNNETNRINIQKRIVSNITQMNPGATFTYLTNYGNSTGTASYTITEADQATIAAADAVIVVAGTPESYSKEDGDRTSIVFNNGQATMISNVGKLNPKTIAVMETCGPMQVTQFENDVAAILWSSFLGNRKVGFGDVITGKVNPSGKTTDTWYKTVSDNGESDIPSIYDYDLYPSEGKQGRTYMYFTGTPSYPFGYGLSYTNFDYSNLTINNGADETSRFDANDTISVSFDVTNTGTVKGKETTQLYVAQPNAPAELMRPIKRLQGFDKIELEPNETKTVTMEVKIPDLAYYNEASDRFIVDTGAYEIQVGRSSTDVPLKGTLNVSGAMTVVPEVVTAKPSQPGDEVLGVEERLIFDKGVTVDPKLTVAMNDESLWGYIIKQQSSHVKKKTTTPFPEGMTFSYSSNRPEVVSVNDGVIKTEAPGVATITATATYNGESASVEFVVYVVSTPYLNDIKVDGVSIPGFKPDKTNYSVVLPSDATNIPNIEPVYTNTDLEVTYEPLKSVPGVVDLVCTNRITNATITYRVGVGSKPVTTDFMEGEAAAVAKGWSFMNRNDNAVFNESGLTITTERGAFSNIDKQPKNVFRVPGLGDWVAQTQVKLSATPTANNQQAGLIIYDNAQNYIRFVYERPSSGGNAIRVYNVVNGVQTQSNSATSDSQTSVYFQIIKQGDTYTFVYSLNGTTWTTFGTNIIANYAFPQIGLYANGGDTDAASISATYEKLYIFDAAALLPRLTSLSVNGAQVAGFDPNTFVYNVEVSESATAAPVLEATADPSYTITYNQINTPKGTASVTVSTLAASATYTVSFNSNPVSDYFADGTLGSNWTVLNENKATYSVDKGLGLRLPTQRNDIYTNGTGWENVVVQPAMGNWEVVAKVFYPNVPTVNYQQAMLLVWQDDNNYIRLNCQQSTLTIQPGWENNGVMGGVSGGNAVASADGTVTIYYRIIKEGTTYSLAFSQDGQNYTKLGNPITGVNFKDPKIGMFATQNSTGNQMNTYFEYMSITNLNGVRQMTYPEMLQDAVDNVKDYVAAGIPAATSSDIVFSKLPHGYTMSVESSNPDVISNDGKINPDAVANKSATLTVTISDGTRSAVSQPIPVTVKSALPKMSMTGSSSVEPESSFTVGLGIYNVSKDVYAEDFTLSFDPDVFEYDTATSDNPNVSVLVKGPSNSGTLRIIAANIGGVKGDTDSLLNVRFKVKDGVKGVSSNISITKAKLGVMPEGSVVTPLLASKTITVGTTQTVDRSELIAALQAAQRAYDNAVEGNDPGEYPAAAKAAFLEAINEATAVNANPEATQAAVDAAAAALTTATGIFENSVIPQPGVDKSELISAINAAQAAYDNSVEGNDPGQYPAPAREAFLTAINAANLVYANPDATQAEVNREVEALAAAKVIFDGSVVPQPGTVKTELKTAIDDAQALYDRAVVGTDNGCYRQADKNVFQLAIAAAKTVFENLSATQQEVDNATSALKAAKAAFEASVITETTGDLNNNASIDVGDLAIIAYYYGAKLGDANWAAAKIADINNDGKVDIEDLAFVALRMRD